MNPEPVDTAVILCSGLGSRFLPMTKAIPKAMLPIIDKPVVEYLVDEAVKSGIKRIVIVIGPEMDIIKKHFQANPKLEAQLRNKGKEELIACLNPFEEVEFYFCLQNKPLGDGNAILQAKQWINGPFAVLFGDEIVANPIPALKQLIELYEEVGNSVLAIREVPKEKLHLYGIIDPINSESRNVKIKNLIEKPSVAKAPSNLGIIGKYICTTNVLDYLVKGNLDNNYNSGEHRLIDAFKYMIEDGKKLSALKIKGERFDTGNKAGLLGANLYFSQDHKDFK